MATPTNLPAEDASPSTGRDPADPLAAFLDGLHGLARLDGVSPSVPAGAAGMPVTMLSNGLNADAGVAQLVSALASVHDGNAAFNATPFAASSDSGSDGMIAAASQ